MYTPRNAYEEPGHFYSPVVSIAEAEREKARLWPSEPNPPAGVDFDREAHERFLANEFTRYMKDFDYPEEEPEEGRGWAYYDNNHSYSVLDSRSLFVMLRTYQPKKMVEVGCGHSTRLTADVSRRFLGGSLDLTCIEPYPHDWLRRGIPGVTRFIERRIQDFSAADLGLSAGDFLFIDTSHVAKLGSDVNHLYFEILPNLAPGVIVHIHDIFFPDDYPLGWVQEGRSWNEQYILQAMLMHSQAFKVLFGGRFAYHYLRENVAQACGGTAYDGCSLWLQRTAEGVTGGQQSLLDKYRTKELIGTVCQTGRAKATADSRQRERSRGLTGPLRMPNSTKSWQDWVVRDPGPRRFPSPK